MKKMLLGIVLVILMTGTAIADTPIVTNFEDCIMTVTGQPSLDGWFMYIARNENSIDVGFHEMQTVPESLIELSGNEMIFDLELMDLNCEGNIVANKELSFDAVKSFYK